MMSIMMMSPTGIEAEQLRAVFIPITQTIMLILPLIFHFPQNVSSQYFNLKTKANSNKSKVSPGPSNRTQPQFTNHNHNRDMTGIEKKIYNKEKYY